MKSAMTKTKENCWQFRLPWQCSSTACNHRPIEHVQGFTGSHWMPQLGKCLRRIAPAAAMVNEFVETTQNTNKTQLLARLVVSEISYPKTDPLIRSSMRRASFKCETQWLELKSSRSFLAIKRCQRTKSKKVIKRSRRPLKSWAHICAHRG